MLRHDNAVVLQRRWRAAGRHAVVIGKHHVEAEIAPQFDHRRYRLHIRGESRK